MDSKIKYHTLERIDSPLGRKYRCPDGSLVPSVTTILSDTADIKKTTILDKWRDNIGIQRATAITHEAASRGTRIHSYLEKYIKENTIKDKVSNPYEMQGLTMAKTIINNGLVNVTEYIESEVQLYFPNLYAGTTDLIAVWNNKPTIIDFKQTNKPKTVDMIDDYFIQLVSYAVAHNEVYGTNINTGVIMMCSVNNEYQEFSITDTEFSYWEQKWWERLETYYSDK